MQVAQHKFILVGTDCPFQYIMFMLINQGGPMFHVVVIEIDVDQLIPWSIEVGFEGEHWTFIGDIL